AAVGGETCGPPRHPGPGRRRVLRRVPVLDPHRHTGATLLFREARLPGPLALHSGNLIAMKNPSLHALSALSVLLALSVAACGKTDTPVQSSEAVAPTTQPAP